MSRIRSGIYIGIPMLLLTAIVIIVFIPFNREPAADQEVLISTVEIVVAVTLAIIILGETISLPKIFGACLIVTAVIILAKSEYETAQATVTPSIPR